MTEPAAARVFRLAIALGLAALAIGAGLAGAQEGGTQEAADRAAETASDVRDAPGNIRAIDPDTLGEPRAPSPASAAANPGAALAPGEVPEADLPPLPGGAQIAGMAERGAAARLTANPVVQAIPAPQPDPDQTSAGAGSDDPFVIKSILPIEGSIRYGEWFWDESAAPDKGTLVITVDLDARVISAFRDGHEIGTAVALLGTRRHPTPIGTFPILTKEKDNISEKYNNAPMPWTLRLTWDGIAIHGSPVINGYASHGCIGVPDPFAKKLFEAARRGDKVVITRGRYIGVGDRILL